MYGCCRGYIILFSGFVLDHLIYWLAVYVVGRSRIQSRFLAEDYLVLSNGNHITVDYLQLAEPLTPRPTMVRLLGTQGAIGATFSLCRLFSIISLIAVIGMTSNFVSSMIQSQLTPPDVLVAILSIVCIATVYCTITFVLFLDNILPTLITLVVDASLVVVLLVISIILGKKLSYIDCYAIGNLNSEGRGALSFAYALGQSVQTGTRIDLVTWSVIGQGPCLESKSVWGLCMALT